MERIQGSTYNTIVNEPLVFCRYFGYRTFPVIPYGIKLKKSYIFKNSFAKFKTRNDTCCRLIESLKTIFVVKFNKIKLNKIFFINIHLFLPIKVKVVL